MLPKVSVYDMADGLRMMLFENADDKGISGVLRANKVYEPNVQLISSAVLNQALPKRNLVLDIGANLGSYVLPLAKRFPRLNFLCFEPQPSIYQQLCGNIFLNSIENVSAVHTALGREISSLLLQLPDYTKDHNIGAFSVNADTHKKLRGDANEGRQVSVPLSTLDSLQLENIALIKVDVEGAELDVLYGGLGTLVRSAYPPVLYEAWDFDWYRPQKEAIEHFLTDLGYSLLNFDGSYNYLAQHPKHGSAITVKR
jgi:FkbM family methyltransferase